MWLGWAGLGWALTQGLMGLQPVQLSYIHMHHHHPICVPTSWPRASSSCVVQIRKNKERAEAESRPKVLKLDDQRRLDEMKQRQAGEL